MTRNVQGDHGESFNQSVAVFANGANQARDLVRAEFARLRKASNSPEHPYGETPEFDVNVIDLKRHKLLIHWISQ